MEASGYVPANLLQAHGAAEKKLQAAKYEVRKAVEAVDAGFHFDDVVDYIKIDHVLMLMGEFAGPCKMEDLLKVKARLAGYVAAAMILAIEQERIMS